MEQTKNNLKIASFITLFLAGLTFVQVAVEVFRIDFKKLELPAGTTEHTILIAQIIFLAITFLILVPQIFVGIRGFKIAKNPDPSKKAHIIWAIVLLSFSVVSLAGSAIAIVKQTEVMDNTFRMFSVMAEVLVFFDYIRSSIALTRSN